MLKLLKKSKEPKPEPDTSKNIKAQGKLSKGCAYALVAFHIQRALYHSGYKTGAVGMAADMTLGIKMLGKHEAPEKAEMDAKLVAETPKCSDKAVVGDLLYYSRFVHAAYKMADKKEFESRAGGLKWDDVISTNTDSSPSKPAFFVAANKERQELLFVIRGTADFSDALTDMASFQSDFLGGRAHSGMVRGVKWFKGNYQKELLKTMQERGLKKLVFAGHSLGAGTAALLTMYAKSEKAFAGVSVRGFAYAPPAAVSKELMGAGGRGEGITSLVCGDDFVTRASLKSFNLLKHRLEEFDYIRKAQEKVLGKTVTKANYAIANGAKKLATKAVCATAPTRGMYKLAGKLMDRRDDQVDKMQLLYPPGRLLHIARGESTDDDPAQLHSVHLLDRDPEGFGRIGLSDCMMSDHKMGTYLKGLESVRASLG